LKKLLFSKRFIPISLLTVFITGALVIYNTCSFADNNRPKSGSVSFGAQHQPPIKTPPHLEAFKSLFADIADNVVPTVVQVIPTKIDTVIFSNNPFYQFFGDPFGFDEFFGRNQQPHRKTPPVEKRQYKQQGLGSGVIVSNDGYILTNYHVVAGADEIEIKTSDNRSFAANIVGVDSLSDVAVVKIKEKVTNLPVAFLGDSDKLRPGDWAIAIGNPFSLASSVTLGIVSALGRTTGNSANAYQNFIQTDAAINPGNSGGALVNIQGELIGINTMIYTQSGGYMGIGFAIPINMARQIMEDLIYEGSVNRGWLGVMIQDLDPASRDAFGLSAEERGVLIGDVFKGQPAEKAGLQRGDIVLSVNNKIVTNTNELRNAIANLRPGVKIPIEILRNNKKIILQVLLTGRDKEKSTHPSSPSENIPENEYTDASTGFGIKAGNLTLEIRKQFGINSDLVGVVVLDVDPESQAAEEGIAQNDIIIEINKKPISSVKDFNQQLKTIKSGDSVLFLLQRENNTFFKAFKIR
jgi:serine protease Do